MIDVIGYIGGLFFLFAFYRTSIGKWTGTSLWYELDNLIGALLMGWYTYHKGAYVSIVLNLVWGIVALRGVTTFAERRMGHVKWGMRRNARHKKAKTSRR